MRLTQISSKRLGIFFLESTILLKISENHKKMQDRTCENICQNESNNNLLEVSSRFELTFNTIQKFKDCNTLYYGMVGR